jgi:hypothetical protein
MTAFFHKPSASASAGFNPMQGLGVRATWSRFTSSRADSKFAPCVARPNLFAGD